MVVHLSFNLLHSSDVEICQIGLPAQARIRRVLRNLVRGKCQRQRAVPRDVGCPVNYFTPMYVNASPLQSHVVGPGVAARPLQWRSVAGQTQHVHGRQAPQNRARPRGTTIQTGDEHMCHLIWFHREGPARENNIDQHQNTTYAGPLCCFFPARG